jgi:hypothetical protein
MIVILQKFPGLTIGINLDQENYMLRKLSKKAGKLLKD